MEDTAALRAFEALGQPSRLAVLRLLIKAGPGDVAAGDIAAQLNLRPNTLSTHLAILTDAGLICAQRQGRSIRYAADMAGLRALVGFLVEDCCGGHPEICAPLLPATLCNC